MKKQYSLFKLGACAVIMVLSGVFAGCQKDAIETLAEDDSEVSLKSTEDLNFIVLSNTENLSDALISDLANYGEIVNAVPEIGMVVVKPQSSNFETKVRKLSTVRSVFPDYKAKWLDPIEALPLSNPPSIGSDENYFYMQWGMDAIDAPEAWNSGVTGEGVKVFVLDSGIDAEHVDLAPNLNTVLSKSFVPDEEYYVRDENFFNHGSHVAGIIAGADNGRGIIGVAPHAQLVAVKVLSEYTGSGDFSWVNEGIVYAANNGADVINMSLGANIYKNGFYLDENDEWQKMPASYVQEVIHAQQRAINYAYKKGCVIVCSAGNGGSDYDGNGSLIKLPGDLNNVVTVAATAPDYWALDYLSGVDPFLDIPASYTDYGRSLVDVAAPGGDFDFYPLAYWQYDMVISCGSIGYYFAAGTSMASPHVAGVAALIIAKNHGEISNHEVVKQLLKTADAIDGNGQSKYFGKGRVNAFRAVTE